MQFVKKNLFDIHSFIVYNIPMRNYTHLFEAFAFLAFALPVIMPLSALLFAHLFIAHVRRRRRIKGIFFFAYTMILYVVIIIVHLQFSAVEYISFFSIIVVCGISWLLAKFLYKIEEVALVMAIAHSAVTVVFSVLAFNAILNFLE